MKLIFGMILLIVTMSAISALFNVNQPELVTFNMPDVGEIEGWELITVPLLAIVWVAAGIVNFVTLLSYGFVNIPPIIVGIIMPPFIAALVYILLRIIRGGG